MDVREVSIDKGIRELVIDLNRIPDLNTYTCCEGEIYRDCPMMPTKAGWIHIATKKDTNSGLISLLQEFRRLYFSVKGPREDIFYRDWIDHSIYAENYPFEDAEYNNLFYDMTTEQREVFFEKAEERKIILLEGWKALGSNVRDYIRKNISQDINSLSYRNGFCQPRIRC